jgi:predicted RND superfamily exporter protein|tara:strand:+ start:189 stop:362 length:174 start_codon:yes stop_codon:yes gene_type:complete
MSQKTFKYLHAFIFLSLGLLLVVKYLDLFPLPTWILGVVIAWAAIAFFAEGMRNRKK